MANNKSAEKRNRQNEQRRLRNKAARSAMRTEVKKVRKALEAGDVAAAEAQLPKTIRTIDVTASKGVVHRNLADRTKSRLTRAVASAKAK